MLSWIRLHVLANLAYGGGHMKKLLFALLILTGCPQTVPPAPVPPDATDAAPTPTMDSSGPVTPCEAACTNLTNFCGAQLPDCIETFAAVDGQKLIREPSGKILTCVDVAAATSKAGIQALGVHCN